MAGVQVAHSRNVGNLFQCSDIQSLFSFDICAKIFFFYCIGLSALFCRIKSVTLADTEKKLNAELEVHALLTTELEFKDELKVGSLRS